MSTRDYASRSLTAVLFVIATALCLASGQEPAPKEGARSYTVSVTVVTAKEPGDSESVVKEATVTVFARDYQQAKRTADGKASFRFETEDKTVTLRVVADKMDPYQQPLELGRGEMKYKVVLTKSN